jgi:pimeloyl-ACP methyl ester carboxylesterase
MAIDTAKRAGSSAGGHFAAVNGVRLYYEVTGSGRPVIVLHGGVGASEMFGPVVPALSEGRQVIAVHLQGHGRTADVDRPLRFESMADDVAALAKHLGARTVDLMGYSLGGGVAMQTAIRHPSLVRKLAIVSAPFRRDAWYPEVLEGMAQMPQVINYISRSPLYGMYPDVKWAALFDKLAELLGRDYDWSKDVAAIKAPVLAVFADADSVRPAHITELFGLLGGGQRDAGLDGSDRPHGQLAVLPGRSHYDVLTHPAFPAIVAAFLDAPSPPGR